MSDRRRFFLLSIKNGICHPICRGRQVETSGLIGMNKNFGLDLVKKGEEVSWDKNGHSYF